MNTLVNVKVDPQTKRKAQKVAEELGFSLSALINAYLKQLVRTKTVNFSTLEENPSEFMLKTLKQSKEEIGKGEISPKFDNADEAISWLNDPNKDYEN